MPLGTCYASVRRRTSPRYFLGDKYHDMWRRVTGQHARCAKYYAGKAILPKNQFVMWACGDAEFWRLWHQWQKAAWIQRLTPSVDRIDPASGYVLDNMRWMTTGANASHPGAHNGRAKLTADQVLLIRSLYPAQTQTALGYQFNVNHDTIHDIVSRRTWRHI